MADISKKTKWCPSNLTESVPSPGYEWIVQVVDAPEDAGARFTQGLVRVERTWRRSIYDAGLHAVMMHYPLSMRMVESRVEVNLWRTQAVQRVYHRGRFTGEIRSITGYVARTKKGNGVACHRNAKRAELLALGVVRSANYKRGQAGRDRARRAESYGALFRERTRLRKYDGGFCVPIADYTKWLPANLVQVFAHCGERGVPLFVIENEIAGLVPYLDDKQIADLMFQLDRDVCEAQAAISLVPSQDPDACHLAEEDSNALEALGGSD